MELLIAINCPFFSVFASGQSSFDVIPSLENFISLGGNNKLARSFLLTAHLHIQWLAEKLDFFAAYDIKWGYFEWRLPTLKVLLFCFFKLSAYRYDLGLLNEILMIIIA